LYAKYAPAIHGRCLRFLRSREDAQDATQEIFLKLLREWSGLQGKEHVLFWVHRTTTNHCISLLRKAKVRRTSELPEEVPDGPQDPERALVLKDVLARLFRPWNQTTRNVVLYAYWDGYDQEEIAGLTGLATSTIRKHLTRFKRKSQAWRKQQGGEGFP
jgi:RNA polymerase sigma-70 factor (ECF subfamily)